MIERGLFRVQRRRRIERHLDVPRVHPVLVEPQPDEVVEPDRERTERGA